MANLEKQFCRLCLGAVTGKNFTLVEDCTRDMFTVLLLNHNFDNETGVTCGICSEKLFAAFEFKTACLHTENTIKTHVYCEDRLPLDMGDIYMKEIENKQFVNMFENQKICRLCMELVAGEFMSVQEIDPVVFQSYIPEINLNFTRDPVACKTCYDSILLHVHFLEGCLNVQRTLIKNNYIITTASIKNENVGTDTTREHVKMETFIESEGIVIESEECKSDREKKNIESQDLRDQDVSKPQRHKCRNCDYQTKYKYNLSRHQLRHKDVSEVKMYKCERCDYQTKRKNDLASHQLKHRDISEVKVYRCKECDYKTKRKNVLASHELKHRDVSEVKMYKCKQCDYQTKVKRYLLGHRLIHRDASEVQMYKCKECDYQTKVNRNLSRHQLTHKDISEVNTYKCKECDYQTKYKNHMFRHQLKHGDVLEVQIYKCNKCDYQTKYKHYLTKHCRKHRNLHI